MDNLFPLADLRDPVAFLTGARVPLTDIRRAKDGTDGQIEWILDRSFYRIGLSFEADSLLCWTEEDDIEPTGIDAARAAVLALDLTSEDTARWVDRKIAEHFMTSQYAALVWSAVLGCTGDVFFIALLGPCGQHSEMALRPHGEFARLASITPTEANIPAARAALLRALFGRETK